MQIDKRYIFPAAMIALNVGASVVAFVAGDWKRGVYWLAGAVCVASVALA